MRICSVCKGFLFGGEYEDFTSLYPFVLAACLFPVGAPTVLYNQDPTLLNEWFGLVQCEVLPPKHLKIPVLPTKDQDGRLIFGLCNSCINEKIAGSCTHDDEQRAVIGIYFTEELKLAVEHGYVVKKVYEVHHWQETSADIFRNYIADFFEKKVKLILILLFISQNKKHLCMHIICRKQMMCELPSKEMMNLVENEFLSEEEKMEAVKSHLRRIAKELCNMDLPLKGEFKDNRAMRFCVKLLLNSLWGR